MVTNYNQNVQQQGCDKINYSISILQKPWKEDRLKSNYCNNCKIYLLLKEKKKTGTHRTNVGYTILIKMQKHREKSR